MGDEYERPGVERPFRPDDEATDEGLLAANILRDHLEVYFKGVPDGDPEWWKTRRSLDEMVSKAALDITNEFFNEQTIKHIVQEFLMFVDHQNGIEENTDFPLIGQEEGQLGHDRIEDLTDSFIELHPFSWSYSIFHNGWPRRTTRTKEA